MNKERPGYLRFLDSFYSLTLNSARKNIGIFMYQSVIVEYFL